jgi:hypothetical protein
MGFIRTIMTAQVSLQGHVSQLLRMSTLRACLFTSDASLFAAAREGLHSLERWFRTIAPASSLPSHQRRATVSPENSTDRNGKYYVHGINGSTGRYLDEPLTPMEVGDAALKQAREQTEAEIRALQSRAARPEPSTAAAMDVDFRELGETGWGVIFARDADPRVKDALQPLLDHREEEVGELFRV